jgi:hypothetical protein
MTRDPWQLEGTATADGDLLIFNKWAEQINRRVFAWRLSNGDIVIEVISTNSGEKGRIVSRVTLTSYRAIDLADAINGRR